MIFKKIFVPAYKSAEPEKRLASIVKLDPTNDKQKAILHELSFNDSDHKVTLAALEKLNDFVLWVKAAEHALSPVVKKHAQHVIYDLLEQVGVISNNEFKTFLSECKNKVILEHVLFSSKRLSEYPELSFSLLQTLDNKQTQKRFYEQQANEQQQVIIVNDTNDVKLLGRYKKMAKSQQVIDQIDAKLHQFELQKEMPAKIMQQMTLVNSRLLALKDAVDFEYLQSQLQSLSQEFEAAKPNFHYLDELNAAAVSDKYLNLKNNLEQKLAALEETHTKQLALAKVSDDLSVLQERSNEVGQQIDLLLTHSEEQLDAQIKILANAIESCQDDLAEIGKQLLSAAHRAQIKSSGAFLLKQQEKLRQLPDIFKVAKQVNDITNSLIALSDKFSEKSNLIQDDVTELQQGIAAQKEQYETVTANASVYLSEASKGAYQQALKHVNNKIKAIKDSLQQQSKKVDSKLRVVNRLINEGKFTAAISTFHHASGLMNQLDKAASNKLVTQFENTKLEIEKLQDWQAYIAQPRKPALLEETQELANTAITDHFERAENVKRLRQQISSFGALHTEQDDALNRAFDEAIEKAFAPCRVFFAELDKLRKENYENAMQIINEALAIDEDTSASELPSMIDKLKKRFQQVGDLDRNNVRKVKRKFTQALKPLQARIVDMQAQNATKKQALIEQASALLTLDDAEEAANQAKALQKQWKEIGFAGKPKENQLWQAFREQNDALFKVYHETLSARQVQQSQALSELDAQASKLSALVKKAITQAELMGVNHEIELLEKSLDGLDPQSVKKASKRIIKLKEDFTSQNSNIEQNKQLNQLKTLFDVLKRYTSQVLPELPDTLPSRYKAWLNQEFVSADIISGLTRNELVQLASILFDDSEASNDFGDSQARKALQMKLMAYKLEGNESILPEAVLAAYVGAGPLLDDESAGADVIFAIFAKQV